MLNKNKVKLTASLHRSTWIAGQRCYVKVCMINVSKKRVRSLTITLIRTTTTFKPRPLPTSGAKKGSVASAPAGLVSLSIPTPMDVDDEGDGERGQMRVRAQMTKEISESVLEMGQNGSKGHASAKGWWTGVAPGQELELSHFILIPVSP